MRPGLYVVGLLLVASALSARPDATSINYATARFERRLEARRVTGPISIDGVLSEADWSTAFVATHFIQNDPQEGAPATYDTEVRFLYDDENLYFGVIAHDAEPQKIIVNDLTRDFNARSGDVFGIVLDTFHDERNGFMFETNPADPTVYSVVALLFVAVTVLACYLPARRASGTNPAEALRLD